MRAIIYQTLSRSGRMHYIMHILCICSSFRLKPKSCLPALPLPSCACGFWGSRLPSADLWAVGPRLARVGGPRLHGRFFSSFRGALPGVSSGLWPGMRWVCHGSVAAPPTWRPYVHGGAPPTTPVMRVQPVSCLPGLRFERSSSENFCGPPPTYIGGAGGGLLGTAAARFRPAPRGSAGSS